MSGYDEWRQASGWTSLLAAYLQSEDEAARVRRHLRGETPLHLLVTRDVPLDPQPAETPKPKRLSLVG